MKAIEYRKAKRDIARACRDHGIEFKEIPVSKGGSHVNWLFIRTVTGKTIRVVVVSGRELSPGVQREILKYLERQAAGDSLAAAVFAIVKSILNRD